MEMVALESRLESQIAESHELVLSDAVKQLEQNKALESIIATQKQIFDFYLKNYKYINNWDLVDLTAHHIVGAYLYDKPKDVLCKLAKSKNLWQKRIAMIATFYYIYRGQSKETIKIAKILLHDDHDLIQKAVGWMLREMGKRVDEKILLKFLDQHATVMPRTMLRYAIERLPESKRQYYLKKKKIKTSLVVIFLLFGMILPGVSQAIGELMISPRDYNVDHTVQPGEIWPIRNLLLVNVGQRDLGVALSVSADTSPDNILAIDSESVTVEMGKAKNFDLLVTTPLDMKPGYYKGQLIVTTPDDFETRIEGSESIVNINFVVAEANYIQALWYRLQSEYQYRDLTFYLALTLSILWLVFFIFTLFKIMKKKIRVKA
jgi:3-methyladenine DNA glycosylase AlkD